LILYYLPFSLNAAPLRPAGSKGSGSRKALHRLVQTKASSSLVYARLGPSSHGIGEALPPAAEAAALEHAARSAP